MFSVLAEILRLNGSAFLTFQSLFIALLPIVLIFFFNILLTNDNSILN